MGRHAYLIIAHNNWKMLHFMIEMLADERNDFFIHIDKKSIDFNREQFLYGLENLNIFFSKSTDVIWGDYSQINAELVLIKMALSVDNYEYLHLLSGIDLPLKNQNYIHSFFETNSNIEYVDYDKGDNFKEAERRCRYYYLFQKLVGRKKNGIIRFIREKIVKIQKICGYTRCKSFGDKLGKGPNWFSITRNFANYVIENEKFIRKHFKNTICADEVFLQTLLNMSPYKKNWYGYLCEDKMLKYYNLRYTDWERGKPYTFKKEDFKELVESPYMFARKFDVDIICDEVREILTWKGIK